MPARIVQAVGDQVMHALLHMLTSVIGGPGGCLGLGAMGRGKH
jgi:hypothetical protein